MTTTKFRDQFLDIAKGLAIILVVIGHVVQGSSEKFDDLFWFRAIYSFHMPLFVFLSGAVAAIVFNPEKIKVGVFSAVDQAKTRIGKAAIRLLLPFISWCVINQLIYHHSESVFSAVALAFRRPDTALWFLLAIFYCITLSSVFDIVFTFLHQILKKLKMDKLLDWIADGRVQITLMVIIWIAIREHTPRGAGFGLIKPYFIYYILGIGFYRYLYPKIETWKYLPAVAIFVAVIPFWDRTTVNNIIAFDGVSLVPEQLTYFYAGVVALSGSFVMIGLAKAITNSSLNWVKKFLILCGQLSLGIYAIHYFFLPYTPKVLFPLLVSLGIALLLNRIPILRTVFLGEK